jgi:transcriptional regulator with XRE-family HTH domain
VSEQVATCAEHFRKHRGRQGFYREEIVRNMGLPGVTTATLARWENGTQQPTYHEALAWGLALYFTKEQVLNHIAPDGVIPPVPNDKDGKHE